MTQRRTLTLGIAAVATLALSPVAAQTAHREAAPVEGESALGNGGAYVLLGLVALGLGLAAFGNDDPISA
ncbi:MAG: hypothetical protein GW855_03850 [Erythrobacter sp.]|nr:hypothetical protein [Erythrobacter sp.]NCQ62637.1 hypothetical protein [Alphaproteobacteria bacterium]